MRMQGTEIFIDPGLVNVKEYLSLVSSAGDFNTSAAGSLFNRMRIVILIDPSHFGTDGNRQRIGNERIVLDLIVGVACRCGAQTMNNARPGSAVRENKPRMSTPANIEFKIVGRAYCCAASVLSVMVSFDGLLATAICSCPTRAQLVGRYFERPRPAALPGSGCGYAVDIPVLKVMLAFDFCIPGEYGR